MNGAANPIASLLAILLIGAAGLSFGLLHAIVPAVLLLVAGLVAWQSIRVARQWERAVVLRAGRLRGGVRGPGLFLILPVIDSVAGLVDLRIQTTPIATDKTLTRDLSPVDVDAIVFWQVSDAERAITTLTDYASSVGMVAQTSLREVIGASILTVLLEDRRRIDDWLRETIAGKTAGWGISVLGVEIRDVTLPPQLQDAMSRQAQAEREKAARVTLASAERQVAIELEEAARTYDRSPTAMQILQINRIYEMNKERGATVLLPTSLADALGGLFRPAPAPQAGPPPPVS